MWAPVEGKYGRTRHGRKVGPARRRTGVGIWKWELPGVPVRYHALAPTADDLEAAARVLTQLAEALRNG